MDQVKYWALVAAGPEEFSHDQRVLLWWVVSLLPLVKKTGAIAGKDPAPLSADEIETVYELIPSGAACGQTWDYENQTVVMEANDGVVVVMTDGKIKRRKDFSS